MELTLLLSDTMEQGKKGISFTPGILPCCHTGNDSAPVWLGRMRPLAVLGWDSQGC